MRFEAPRSNTCPLQKIPNCLPLWTQHWPWRTGTRPKDTEPVQASENSTSVECFCGLSVVTLQASKHMHVGSPVNSIMLAQIFTVGKGPTALVLCMLWLDPSQIDPFCHIARRGEEALHTFKLAFTKKASNIFKKSSSPNTKKQTYFFSHTSSSVHSKNKNCRSGGLLILQGFFDARRPWGFHPPPIRWIRGFRAQLRRASLVVHGNRNAGKPPTS